MKSFKAFLKEEKERKKKPSPKTRNPDDAIDANGGEGSVARGIGVDTVA